MIRDVLFRFAHTKSVKTCKILHLGLQIFQTICYDTQEVESTAFRRVSKNERGMKMKKLLSAVLAALLIFTLAACGSSGAKTVDVQKLADDLLNNLPFGEMSAVSADELGFYIDIPEGSEAVGYMSAGSTFEEVIVVSCTGDNGEEIYESLRQLVEGQKQEAERYQPEEVARLENCVLEGAFKAGFCVLVVSSESDTAAADAIIKEYK